MYKTLKLKSFARSTCDRRWRRHCVVLHVLYCVSVLLLQKKYEKNMKKRNEANEKRQIENFISHKFSAYFSHFAHSYVQDVQRTYASWKMDALCIHLSQCAHCELRTGNNNNLLIIIVKLLIVVVLFLFCCWLMSWVRWFVVFLALSHSLLRTVFFFHVNCILLILNGVSLFRFLPAFFANANFPLTMLFIHFKHCWTFSYFHYYYT